MLQADSGAGWQLPDANRWATNVQQTDGSPLRFGKHGVSGCTEAYVPQHQNSSGGPKKECQESLTLLPGLWRGSSNCLFITSEHLVAVQEAVSSCLEQETHGPAHWLQTHVPFCHLGKRCSSVTGELLTGFLPSGVHCSFRIERSHRPVASRCWFPKQRDKS